MCKLLKPRSAHKTFGTVFLNNNRYLSRVTPPVARTVMMEALTSRTNSREMLVFMEGGKSEIPEKNPRSKERTNNKLSPHETLSTGIELGSQGWDAKAYPLCQSCSPKYEPPARQITYIKTFFLVYFHKFEYLLTQNVNEILYHKNPYHVATFHGSKLTTARPKLKGNYPIPFTTP